jgi:hypothetical protein
MSEDASSSSAARAGREETSGWAVGFILFAAIMMIMVGAAPAVGLLLGVTVGAWLG